MGQRNTTKKNVLTAFWHGMEGCQHINGYMMLEIVECGEARSPTSVGKELNHDDDDIGYLLRHRFKVTVGEDIDRY